MFIPYNLFSLAAGVLSWFLAARSLARKGSQALTFSSLILCILSLLSQFFQLNRLVTLHDWAAIEDTFPAIQTAALTLVAITLLLNIAAISGKKQ